MLTRSVADSGVADSAEVDLVEVGLALLTGLVTTARHQ